MLKMKDASFTWFRGSTQLEPEVGPDSSHTLNCDFQSDEDDDDALIELGNGSDDHHHFDRVMKINLYKLNLDVKKVNLVQQLLSIIVGFSF